MLRMTRTAMLVLASLALGGCATIDNDRTTAGGQALTALTNSGSEPFTPAAGPSVTSMSRDGWDEVTVLVASDTTQHHPHLTNGGPAYAAALPRQRGEYPDAMSALDLGSETRAQVHEAFAAPFHGAWDVVMAIPRLIMGGNTARTSPTLWYERGPLGPDDLAPALEPQTLPVDDAERPEGAPR
ncbi:MAG TPA: hypothetical protein DEB06_08065 [Phycisphaerales bacterium]|nr:hypothetical protein [Phycisphaerales bacterium]